jgi:hypothetical protein
LFVIDVVWSSVTSSKGDDEEGVRIIFERSLVLESEVGIEDSFDLKILYASSGISGKSNGNRNLVVYGENFLF